MSMNKQLADFSSQSKRKAQPKTQNNDDNFDDARSEQSYVSMSQQSVGQSSNFSSAFKKPPQYIGYQNDTHQQNETSVISSQMSYEDFPNAEYQALEEEEKAKRRKEEKEQKMKEFMKQTQQNAKAKLQKEQNQKQAALENQLKEKERLLKAKEYSKKQREIVSKSKKGNVSVLSSDPAGAHTNYHAQIKKEQQDLDDAIPEASEIDEKDKTANQSILNEQKPQDQEDTNQQSNQLNLVDLYNRIDQSELDKLGVNDKQALPEQAIQDVHEYSMLQRFRQNKDFKQVDKSKPKSKVQSQYTSNQTDKENKWWISGTTVNTEQLQKQQVEKSRYLKALKALVKEKGEKLEVGEIPNLCNCGALNENLYQLKKGQPQIHMCASNCQFYNNQKDYEKALRDILHSISLFK